MSLGIEPVQVGLVVAVAIAAGYVWSLAGRGQWYAVLSKRFLYGVPWGTFITIAGVVAFYLFVQSGLQHWSDPVTLPFRSWSYRYPEGMFAAGFAHVSPAHLLSNMTGTIVLAPIVEYAWGHYPPDHGNEAGATPRSSGSTEPTDSNDTHWQRPWIRALVIFPLAVFVVSLLTSVFALGWSLGFSGTVFAFGGFAVVYFPLAAIITIAGFASASVTINAVQDPVLRATAESGAPGPPGWWGVNVQAHLLGFLIGVLLALALLRYRDERRRPEWVFSAALVFGLAQQLYALTASGGEDVFLQLRGIGVIFVLGVAVLITAVVAADDTTASPFEGVSGRQKGRLVSLLWIAAVGTVAWSIWVSTVGDGTFTPLAVAFAPLLVFLAFLPIFRTTRRVSSRQILTASLAVLVVVVAVPSVASNAPGMSDDPVPEGETITVDDYEITYAEDAAHGRIDTTASGVIVVSERRQIWTAVVDSAELEHDGEITVPVGGAGWREPVTATRTGWIVTGGEAVYTVELSRGGETVRAFTSEPAEARARVAGRTITVENEQGAFRASVIADGESLGSTALPGENETATVAGFEFQTERIDDTLSVFVQSADTRVLVATKEQY